jgi:NADH:ubiquinone oxidoreductase subunit 5 (subunit L)/multisubunit Na+/H+ antiporter MnhA subunit
LLISFWFTRLNAVQSAIQAFLLNRVGDMFLILALARLSSRLLSLDQIVICFVRGRGLLRVV